MSMFILKVLFITLPSALCLYDDVIKSSIDYLTLYNMKTACLFTCNNEGLLWNLKFARAAATENIKVSTVFINNNINLDDSVQRCLHQKYEVVGSIIDSNCLYFEEVMTIASQNKWLDARHKWIIRITRENSSASTTNDSKQALVNMVINEKIQFIHPVLNDLNLSVDTDIALFLNTGFSGYNIYEAFNFGKIQGGDLVITQVGTWSSSDGLVMWINGYKYYRRWNFRQLALRMSIVVSNATKTIDPEMLIGTKPAPGVAIITLTSASVLHAIAEIHNFRFKYSTAEVWIGQNDRNSSNKIVTAGLYFQEQDISPLIRFLPGVFDHVDLAHPPTTFLETKFYYRIPTLGPGKLENKFLTPFSVGVWYSVIAITLLCSIVLVLSAKVEARPLSLQYAVFSVVAAFCQQFFDDNATVRNSSTARKMTVFVTGLSCVLLYNYYTSSVVSWLLSGPPPSINSLEELLDSPLELILEDIGYSRSWVELPGYYYFNKRNAEIEDELRQKKIFNKKRDSIYKSVEDGIEMVKAGGYAFNTQADNANILISRKFTQTELCELGSLQSMEKAYLYTCLQKNSPFKEFFVWSLARMKERGIISCIKHRHSAPVVRCEGSSPRALALGGAAPAFVLLTAGYLLATGILLAERLSRLNHRTDLDEISCTDCLSLEKGQRLVFTPSKSEATNGKLVL